MNRVATKVPFRTRKADLSGKVVPMFENGQPILLKVEGEPGHWVPVFNTIRSLDAGMRFFQKRGYVAKLVTDGTDFCEAVLKGGCRILLNPYMGDGKLRWTEVSLDG